MKTLTLLRHAKSSWDDPVARDFDRPLNARGQRAAVIVGRHMRNERLAFDHVVASPALRVVETIAEFEGGFGTRLEPAWDRRAYLASATTLMDIVRETPAQAARLLLIGHNPGLEELVLLLVADGGDELRDRVEEKYPTASVAELSFEVEDWTAVDEGRGELTRFVRPRDVDPTLGPEYA